MRHDDTLEFTRRIQSALTPNEVCQEVLKVTGQYGLDQLIAGTIPAPHLRPCSAKSHILFAGWSDAWMKRYIARSYVYVDPVIRRVQETPGASFRWSEAEAAVGDEKEAKLMMRDAREHGLSAGFAVPFVTLEGEIATVSFGGERMDLPPVAAGLIHLIGIFAMGRAFQLQDRPNQALERLSQREVEVMKWTSLGKNAWDISVILGISEHTVHAHVARATAKLGATNKTHAVAEAIRFGVIT